MSNFNNASLIVTPNAVKAGKLYSIKPTNGAGDLDVVRATTATYVGSDGLIKTALANVPRLDYTNGSCPSILVEPQRTNLLTYSEDFSNATWYKASTTINSNTIIAPNGNLSADGIYPNNGVNFNIISASGLYTSGNYSYLQKSAGVLSVGTYTFSFFIKKNNLRYIQPRVSTDFTLSSSPLTNNILDLQNKTIYLNDSASTVKIKDYSNDFVRYEITFNVSTSATYYFGFWYWKETSGVTDGTLGYNIWGAQVEAGSNATSYIPTTTSTVTRNADVISKSGIYTNGLITSNGGTMFIELKNNIPVIGSNVTDFNLGIGSTSNGYGGNGSLSLWNFTAVISRLQILKNVGGTYSTLYTSTTDNCKIVIKWNGTTVDVFENGVKVVNASSFNITNMNFLYGNGQRRTFLLNKMFLFNTPLTDAQAIQLTTL